MILAGWGLTALIPLTWIFVDDFTHAIPLLLLVSWFAPIAMAADQALGVVATRYAYSRARTASPRSAQTASAT